MDSQPPSPPQGGAGTSLTLRQHERMVFVSDACNHLLVPAEKLRTVLALCRLLELG